MAELDKLPRCCPQYADKRAVGVLASLYPDDSIIRRATQAGVFVMGMGDEAMTVMNPEALKGRRDAD